MKITHHHLIYQAETGAKPLLYSDKQFTKMFRELLELLNMEILISPQIAISKHNAWTGIMGIVTSHITFHYWIDENEVQFDIYSCKEFDIHKAIDFLNQFWDSRHTKTLYINRAGQMNKFNIVEL